MTTQTEMFPAAEADRAQAVLNFLLTRREKAEKALATAKTNLDDIIVLITKQEHIVHTLREQAITTPTIVDPLYAMADAEPEPEDAEVLAIDGVAVAPDGSEYDTATGEVIDQEPEPAPADGAVCPACDGDGRIPDKTGGGHHGTCQTCGGSGRVEDEKKACPMDDPSCEGGEGDCHDACAPGVAIACPDGSTIISDVGPYTRYGELIADYLTEAGLDEEIDAYLILADDGITRRNPSARIIRHDYGRTMRVVRKAEAVA